MRLRLWLAAPLLGLLFARPTTSISVPSVADEQEPNVDVASRDGFLNVASEYVPERVDDHNATLIDKKLDDDTTHSILSAMLKWKRSGGYRGSRGGSGSGSPSTAGGRTGSMSSGSSLSPSGNKGSRSSASAIASSRSGSGSGSSSSSSSAGSASNVRQSYGGGQCYAGGSTTSYASGQRSPSGITPSLFGGADFAFFPTQWVNGVYAYAYDRPYYFYNLTGAVLNGTGDVYANPCFNYTLNVTCLCAEYQACGCDDTGNQTLIDVLLGNGSWVEQNVTLVQVDSTSTSISTSTVKDVYINGTLDSDTTDSSDNNGDSSSTGSGTSSTSTSTSSTSGGGPCLATLRENGGWWFTVLLMTMIVYCITDG